MKISMWSWYTEQEDEFPKLQEEFNATHPGIQVEIRVYGLNDYLPTLEAAMAGGTAPDILAPHVRAIEYGLAGQTVVYTIVTASVSISGPAPRASSLNSQRSSPAGFGQQGLGGGWVDS